MPIWLWKSAIYLFFPFSNVYPRTWWSIRCSSWRWSKSCCSRCDTRWFRWTCRCFDRLIWVWSWHIIRLRITSNRFNLSGPNIKSVIISTRKISNICSIYNRNSMSIMYKIQMQIPFFCTVPLFLPLGASRMMPIQSPVKIPTIKIKENERFQFTISKFCFANKCNRTNTFASNRNSLIKPKRTCGSHIFLD